MFAKPLISAGSAWLGHGRAPRLISDSIRREPRCAVSGRYSSKVRRVIYSLCGAHHPDATHTVTSLHLWYLATKSGEGEGWGGWRGGGEGEGRGGDHVYFMIEIRRVARQVFDGPILQPLFQHGNEIQGKRQFRKKKKNTSYMIHFLLIVAPFCSFLRAWLKHFKVRR